MVRQQKIIISEDKNQTANNWAFPFVFKKKLMNWIKIDIWKTCGYRSLS